MAVDSQCITEERDQDHTIEPVGFTACRHRQ